MNLSFLDFLRTGELLPVRFGMARSEVIELFGIPDSWVCPSDPLFEPPTKSYLQSDSISFGRLTFTFDPSDCVESIMIDCSKRTRHAMPPSALFFPEPGTPISDIAKTLESFGIEFRDASIAQDGSQLTTTSGVELVSSANGELWYCSADCLPPSR